MALTLEQYAQYLDGRGLDWPAPPEVESPRAKPHLVPLRGIRAVTWNPYGTLLAITGGELLFEHPKQLVMDLVLEKTIEEFKIWGSMSRKPGQPSEYFRQLYLQVLNQLRTVPGEAERHPEVAVDKVWQALIKKLLQKDYKFDTGFYGALNEFASKVAYFFHASLQGIAAYPGAVRALSDLAFRGTLQGLLGNGQCFTMVQVKRCLTKQDTTGNGAAALDQEIGALSFEAGVRQPSDKLFRFGLERLAARGIKPQEVLHVGSRIGMDVVPARRLGMRTALFAGDRASLHATTQQLGRGPSRPDVLVTELTQIAEIGR
jgi:FMN phosphatase YigB (HAD superfamily)